MSRRAEPKKQEPRFPRTILLLFALSLLVSAILLAVPPHALGAVNPHAMVDVWYVPPDPTLPVTPAAHGTTEPAPVIDEVWVALAECESHGQWDYGPHSNWGSRIYHGGLQWKPSTWSTWKAVDDPEYAYMASAQQEVAAAERLRAAEVAAGRGGFGPWPMCADKLGLPR